MILVWIDYNITHSHILVVNDTTSYIKQNPPAICKGNGGGGALEKTVEGLTQ